MGLLIGSRACLGAKNQDWVGGLQTIFGVVDVEVGFKRPDAGFCSG